MIVIMDFGEHLTSAQKELLSKWTIVRYMDIQFIILTTFLLRDIYAVTFSQFANSLTLQTGLK